MKVGGIQKDEGAEKRQNKRFFFFFKKGWFIDVARFDSLTWLINSTNVLHLKSA